MSYGVPVFCILVLMCIIASQSYLPKWLKWLVGVYYSVGILLFSYLQTRLADKWYVHTPVPDEYWDANSRLTDIFAAVFFIPVCILSLILYYNWFRKLKKPLHRVYLGISVIPVLLIGFICFFMFEFLYGYRP
ncbi:hypothetical protein [Priestia megaterium]|uniref:hypothetical protein n=1 Tax=Priestia megaterium TaxID=1404 RepID=UPI000BF80FFF|nr:hypothetical protein [Priestia megaterium]PFQ80864.1 hypothetical protein COK11_19695 [Priestia megaterium]